MPTQDISRLLNQPEKHYAGVRMQQGRVILDSDWNERSSIEAEDLRRTISELACSKGTPNAGMSVSTVAANVVGAHPTYNFHLANGSYYLGGMRLVVDAADGWEAFQSQTDWLQVDSQTSNMPAAAVGSRIDLAYVVAWEQPVCAVEDSELFEVALGGRDTSVRMRRMRRFEVMTVSLTNSPTFDSADGFDALVTQLELGNATFDRTTSELLSHGRLELAPHVGGDDSEDPCNLPQVDGYVGAENRAIRVELRGAGTLTWGFDNASPLYRVKGNSATPDLLTFLTLPADLASMPRAGQVVEILRWGAKLPNMEKVAETQGVMAKVTTTYDPTTRQLVLDTDIPLAWFTWLAGHSVHYNVDDEEDEQQYFYLRVWDRGSDTADAEIEYTVDAPFPLGSTGLQATVTTDGMPGDFWVIAARPTTPDKFVPWNMDSVGGVAPHGPRRFYAPLALIRWTAGAPVTSTVDDARTRLRTLCEGGCCQVSVGDGKESHGQVETLQEAIDLLGPTGGKICVLPGVHEGTAVLDGLNDIVIEGCGPRTVLTNPRAEIPSSDFSSFYDPVLTIVDCERITVKDLRIEAYSALGIHAHRTLGGTCERVTLDHLEFRALGALVTGDISPKVFELPHSGLAALGVTGLDVLDCRFETAAIASLSYSVVLGSNHVRMHRCFVVPDTDGGGNYVSPGGVNIRSTSRDVEIVGCHIEGGWGHGIALGHLLRHARTLASFTVTEYEANIDLESDVEPVIDPSTTLVNYDGCTPVTSSGTVPVEDDDKLWLPAGPVEDIRIHDNVIRGMSLSGISTAFFFPADFDWDDDGQPDNAPRFIVAAEIDIARNLIEGNAQNGSLPSGYFLDFDVGVGGIVLAASVNAWIHENTIRNNGTGYNVPICGVGLVAAQNAVIEDNRILDNGGRHPGGSHPFVQRGLRGGIVIYEATPVRAAGGKPTFPATIENLVLPRTQKDYTTASGGSAVIVRGNEVSQPLGKALWVRRGFGAITVTGNSLEGFGDPVNVVLEGVALRWKSGTTPANSVAFPARTGLVEIIDYGYAMELETAVSGTPEISWCEVEGGTHKGGAVTFSTNICRLEWRVLGGCAMGLGISSLDSVSVCANTMSASMMTDYGSAIPFSDAGSPVDSFMADIFSAYSKMSFLVAHLHAGAAGTVLVQGNRVIEGPYDALFSIVCSSALHPEDNVVAVLTNGLIMMNNVMTHCSAVDSGFVTLASGNISIVKAEALGGGACPYLVTQAEWGLGRVLTIS